MYTAILRVTRMLTIAVFLGLMMFAPKADAQGIAGGISIHYRVSGVDYSFSVYKTDWVYIQGATTWCAGDHHTLPHNPPSSPGAKFAHVEVTSGDDFPVWDSNRLSWIGSGDCNAFHDYHSGSWSIVRNEADTADVQATLMYNSEGYALRDGLTHGTTLYERLWISGVNLGTAPVISDEWSDVDNLDDVVPFARPSDGYDYKAGDVSGVELIGLATEPENLIATSTVRVHGKDCSGPGPCGGTLYWTGQSAYSDKSNSGPEMILYYACGSQDPGLTDDKTIWDQSH